jgi:hypothetical protein
MTTRIELLKQAGFSDAEIGDWATAERQRMNEQGFTDDEIDDEFGVTRPPQEVPESFIERLKQGNAASRIAGTAADYAHRYYGDEPLGFSPKTEEFLRKLGTAGDIIIPAAKPVDAVLRAVSAGIAGVGAGFGQALEEAQDATVGPGPQAKGKAARDFASLAQIAAMLSGANRTGPAPGRVLEPKVMAAPAIMLPRAEDFRNAAAAISGMPASFSIEQKLLQLWKEHGISPLEVAQDAARDRTIAADLASESAELPEVYVGAGKETPVASGKPGAPAQSATPGDRIAATEERPADAMAAENQPLPGSDAPPPEPRIAESRHIGMYPPPGTSQRPFKFDYRRTPVTDDTGRLLEDIEKRPLDARFVVGRRFAGGNDVPLTPDEMKAAVGDLKIRLDEVPTLPMDDDVASGLYFGREQRRRPVGELFVKSTYSAGDQNIVLAHEFGHAIDHYAKWFSDNLAQAEIGELRKVYAVVRGRGRKKPVQPEDFGYGPNDVNGELAAEGLRAYLMDPNWFKAVAPRSAARFRAEVNRNKYLKRVIQFNSLGAAGLLSAGAGSKDQDDQ